MKNISDTNKEILISIRRARDRMHSIKILDISLKSLLLGLGLYFLLAIIARFFPIYNIYLKGAFIAVTICIIGFIATLFLPPDNKKAALLLDSKGLKERTITAYELLDENSNIALTQKKDALKHINNINIKEEIKITLPKKVLALCFILIILIFLSAFIANPMEAKAEELNNIKIGIKNQEKEIEEIIKKVENNKRITDEAKMEAIQSLKDLKKELNKSKDLNEALKAIQRAENKINKIKEKHRDKDMEKIIESFSKNKETKSLADALKAGDTGSIKKNIMETAKALQSLDDNSLSELSKSLTDLSKSLSANPELAEAIINLSQKITDGELGDIQQELGALASEIEKLVMGNEEFKKAMDDIIDGLNCAACKNPGADSGQGKGENTGAGAGGQGAGGQSGGGGSAGAGGGAGAGSGQGTEGTSHSSAGGFASKNTSGGELKEYEKVFTTNLLGGQGEKELLQGQKGQEGQIKVFKTEEGLTIKGEMLPYNQVIGEYKEQAFQNIEGSYIPQGMQNLVKDYFTSLGE